MSGSLVYYLYIDIIEGNDERQTEDNWHHIVSFTKKRPDQEWSPCQDHLARARWPDTLRGLAGSMRACGLSAGSCTGAGLQVCGINCTRAVCGMSNTRQNQLVNCHHYLSTPTSF